MRTTIDQHISDLLYYHECVVVPEFGAFLTRFYAAEINTATNMFRPPSKRVAFNQRIKENDGLLAKHIAKVESVSYEEAMESIAISVRSWRKILKGGKKINLNGVGRLYLDDDGLLQFNPSHATNYHIQSYGLNFFRASPMEREEKIKQSVNRAIENKGRKKGKQLAGKQNKKKQNKSWPKWAAVLGPVVAIVLVGSYYFTQENEAFDNSAGIVSEVFEEDGEATAASDSMADEPESSSASTENGALERKDGIGDDATENLYNVKERPNGESSEEDPTTVADMQSSDELGGSIAEDDPQISAEPESAKEIRSGSSVTEEPAEKMNERPAYQIIVGSFAERSNAQNYVDELKNKGYEAYLAGTYGNFNRVAIGRFQSQSEAMRSLQGIRSGVNYSAWLHHN